MTRLLSDFAYGDGPNAACFWGPTSIPADRTPQAQGDLHTQIAIVGAVPVGALTGGLLGEFIGLKEALFAGVIGEALAVAWLLASPVRSLRSLPDATNT